MSLEEVLAPFQQTWIQVGSTGVAKEEQDFCPPFQSTIRVLQGRFNGIDNTSILDDTVIVVFVIIITTKIEIVS